ncbi:MAG: hypothetical protein HQL87_15165 [Magnetococcales bacterium]|nr:hypothetical protein [Magnetococcales bacterium]
MRVKTIFFLPFFAALLTGCVAGQTIDMAMKQPEVKAASLGIPVVLQTTDQRPYVLSGNKSPAYIGHYRGGFGNVFDVKTVDAVALATMIQKDLLSELTGLGFQVGDDKQAKIIKVEIKDWNFNAYLNGRFVYALELSINDPSGQNLYKKNFSGEEVINGSIWTGAKGAFEREMPKIYSKVLKSLLHENAEALNVLKK